MPEPSVDERRISADEIPPFDLFGPLPPRGVTVLEASAGTGKTFTIAALAVRFVAMGVPIDEILVVTFTRLATSELRDRVRHRLVTAAEGLRDVLDGGACPPGDELVEFLAGGPRAELTQRADALRAAVANFDAATIATTHGFCQQVLQGLGVLGDAPQDAVFIEEARDLVEEVVDDLYTRHVLELGQVPFDRNQALAIGQAAVENPGVPIEPRHAPPNSPDGLRRRLAATTRNKLDDRKRAGGLLTYDDLLTRLQETLTSPERGEAACERLRRRYRVALVDEFQDTDPIQWEILQRAFGSGQATLVLIGDPKQAIYGFRGADVYAYLDAARQADAKATLSTNFRSDAGYLAAVDALLRGARLGHAEIPFRTVEASADHREPGLRGAPDEAPLRFRILDRADAAVRTAGGKVAAVPGRQLVAADLAADVARLLSSPAHVRRPGRADDGRGRMTAVRPGDIAVLVRYNRTAAEVSSALRDVGVRAVMGGTVSVYTTPAAAHWARLLEALEQPSSRASAAAAALTPFLGLSPAEVATADDRVWEDVHTRLHGWADLIRRRGVAFLLEAISSNENLPGRMLSWTGGERELTDLRHVGELLHGASVSGQLGLSALRVWLRRRIDEPDDARQEDRSRRLESDADAVQILTIHAAKGLEFPIVYCPDLWEAGGGGWGKPVVYHDRDRGDARTLDVAMTGADFELHQREARTEDLGEDVRLLYVALTRARHQTVVWWAGSRDTKYSCLLRVVMGKSPQHGLIGREVNVPADATVFAKLDSLNGDGGRHVSVALCGRAERPAPAATPSAPPTLDVQRFRRALDDAWRRTSYSGITAAAHDAGGGLGPVASEADEPGTTDEPAGPAGPGALPAAGRAEHLAAGRDDDPHGLRSVSSLLGQTPGGAEVGTLVHRVLEVVDFTAPDLAAAVSEALAEAHGTYAVDIGEPDRLINGLVAAIETPLGPLVDGLALRQLGRGDRLDELTFELPLAGGDQPRGSASTSRLAAVLAAGLPAGDPLAGYPARLDDPAVRSTLRGYLTGSIDLVLRTGTGSNARYAVVDYKTNWLGPAWPARGPGGGAAGPASPAGSQGGAGQDNRFDGAALSAWHYRPEALAAEMVRAHYPLQALLYQVALHRYLRWRVPGYNPERHLAGVLYLFLRGMTGPATPVVDGQPCGLFAWRPPAEMVVALSDSLDGEGGS